MSQLLIIIALFQAMTLGAALLRAKGLSVLLGPSGFGIASIIDQIVLAVVQLSALGLPFTAMKFMSNAHSHGSESFRRTSASFARIITVLAFGATGLSVSLLFVFPSTLGTEIAPYRLQLQIALLGVAPIMLSIFFVQALSSVQKPIAAALFGFLVAVGLAIAAILGTVVGGLTGLYVATTGFGIVMTASVFAYLRMAIQFSLFGQGISLMHEMRSHENVVMVAGAMYMNLIGYHLSWLAVRYIVLARLGEAASGLFQASFMVAMAVGSITMSMSNLYLAPILNRNTGAEKKFDIAHEFAGRLLVLLLIGALPAVLFPGTVIDLLFTDAFSPAATLLAAFVIWQCLYQLIIVYLQLLIGLDQPRFMAASAIAGFAIAAMLAGVLIDWLGMAGAPAAMAAGALLSGAMIFFRLALYSGMTIPRGLVVRAVYVLTMLALAAALFEPGGEGVLSGIGLRLGFAAIALGFMWPMLDKAERSLIAYGPRILLRRLRTAPRNP